MRPQLDPPSERRATAGQTFPIRQLATGELVVWLPAAVAALGRPIRRARRAASAQNEREADQGDVSLLIAEIEATPDEGGVQRTCGALSARPVRRARPISRRLRHLLVPTTLLVVLASLATLTACGPTREPGPPSIRQVEHPAARHPIDIGVCDEADTRFRYTQQAQQWIAQGLLDSIRPNAGEITITLNYIDADSLDGASAPLAITVPAVGAYPPDPTATLEKYPPPSGNSWYDAQVRQQIDARNKGKIDDYTAGLGAIDAQRTAARDAATKAAQALRSATPPAALTGGQTADVWGCFSAQAARFGQVSAGTTRVLLFCSAMDERHGWANVLSPAELSGLSGAYMVVAFFDPQGGSASFDQYKRSTWQAVFSAVHADPHEVWLDPVQTQATSPDLLFHYAETTSGGSP